MKALGEAVQVVGLAALLVVLLWVALVYTIALGPA